MVKKADDSLVDSVILQAAVEVEHHEIGVYENLLINANAMQREDVVAVLARNCESRPSRGSPVWFRECPLRGSNTHPTKE